MPNTTPNIPDITIFVRHSIDCEHKDDGELYMRCHCRKHLRWSWKGVQYRQSAKTRSREQAILEKRRIEQRYLEGEEIGATKSKETQDGGGIENCVASFVQSKKNDEVSKGLVAKYERELGRLADFLKERAITEPSEVTADVLISFKATWKTFYPSTLTRSKVQERLRQFLRYLNDAGHIKHVPKLGTIRVDAPPTIPLTKDEYERLLAAIPVTFPGAKRALRMRALVRLMRHSGLAIRDAATLSREEITHDKARGLWRIVTSRQKTGHHVSVIIPEDVAQELVNVLNGNPQYIFWTGISNGETVSKFWQRQFRKLRKPAQLPDLHSHQLRDTFAVDLLSKGVLLQDVSKLLGHSSVKTTEKSYAPWVKARQDRLDAAVKESWD